MAASTHPTFHESVVLLGAALAYTLDHWEDFTNEFGTDFAENEDKTMDEIKVMMTHLFHDLAMQLDQDDLIQRVIKTMRTILSGQ